jgi:hypothetical protein
MLNLLENASGSTICGGIENKILSGSEKCTISGGQENTIEAGTKCSGIGGGVYNTIQDGSYLCIIGGGYGNIIESDVVGSVIGGGQMNTVQISARGATIGGGAANTIQSDAMWSTVGGGFTNRVLTGASHATIGGGDNNTIQANSASATLAGGYHNTIANNAFSATIGGGGWNSVGDGAIYATVPGGLQNTAGGNFSFAAGYRAKTTSPGAFVWGDSTDHDIWAANANEFVVRATGGVYFFTAVNPADGFPTSGVQLHAGDPGWQNWCDRDAKENFREVDTREVLDRVCNLPVTEWNMKAQAPSVRHLGPMAQDFHATFGLGGDDDKCICSVDVDGVALAAIQGLNQKVEEKDAELNRLKEQNRALTERLTAIERALGLKTNPLAPPGETPE